MNAIIANIKKDMVSVRGLVIAMGIVLFLALIIRILPSLGLPITVSGKGNLGGTIQFLIMALLIVKVIHQDPLTDPGAFWRTRPISRPQLLLAKAGLLIPAFMAALIVIQPWFSTSQKGGISFLELCITFSGLAAFATVRSSFSKMFGLLFNILITGIVLAVVLSVVANCGALAWNSLASGSISVKPGIAWSGQITFAIGILIFVGFLFVTVFQYLTLNTRISERLIFCICLVGLLAMSII